MEIRLLGSGGADGVPGFYSNSRVSQYAREHRGKDIRTRAAALIDGSLKIDLPPDSLMQLQRDSLSASDWSGILFTHGDDDHFAPRELQYALYPFTELDHLTFQIFGNEMILERVRVLYPDWPIEMQLIEAYKTFKHGDFTITPIEANHNQREECFNHIIERNGRVILYATDTGYWREDVWGRLAAYHLDALIIECTEGRVRTSYTGHLDVPGCIDVVTRLRKEGILGKDSQVVTTHHAHQGDMTHQELVDSLSPYNIEVGYDGLTISV